MLLLTPRDWATICRHEAAVAGDQHMFVTPRAKLAEARRYIALADEIDRLRLALEAAREDLAQLQAFDNAFRLAVSCYEPCRLCAV